VNAVIITVLLVALSGLAGCSTFEREESVAMNGTVTYREGVSHYDIANPEFPVDFSGMVNADVALATANAIFAEFQNQDRFKGMYFSRVFHDVEEGVFIVSYGENPPGEELQVVIGGCLCIAISTEDGRVVNIWVGE